MIYEVGPNEMTETQLLDGQSGLPVVNPTSSYWHKEPSEKLLGHRSTTKLPNKADVLIVGSGITGAFAALTLKEQKPELDVVMLEAREACWGATGRNGGHCQPLMYTSPPHIASFQLRTYSYIKSLVETQNVPCDWHSTTGVHAYFSDSLFNLTRDVVNRLYETHPELAANVAIVTKGEGGSAAWLPETGQRTDLTLQDLRIPDAEGAVVQRHAASLWPYKLVVFILEHLLAESEERSSTRGTFNLQTNTAVMGLQKVDPPDNPSGHNSSAPTWIVHTRRGHIAARYVLLATNGYTSHLLPGFTDLIAPIRGQVAALKPPHQVKPGEWPLDPRYSYYLIDGSSGKGLGRDEYLIQRPVPATELILGGGRKQASNAGVGIWDDSGLDEPVCRWLRGELPTVMDLGHNSSAEKSTKKQDLKPTHEWTGIMGFSRDAHPWVGAVPAWLGGGEGLWVCAGYTGNGMPNAALCAKAVAAMMLGADEVDLPTEYKLTAARVEAARARDTMAVADKKGVLALGCLA